MNFAPFAILLIYLILIDQTSSASLRKYIKQHWGSVSNIPQESGSSANRVDSGDHGNDENYGQTKRFGLTYSRKRKKVDQDVQAQRQDEKQPKRKRKRGRPRTKTDKYRKKAPALYKNRFVQRQKLALLSDDPVKKAKAEAFFRNRQETDRKRYAETTRRIETNTATKEEVEKRKEKKKKVKEYFNTHRLQINRRRRERYKKNGAKILAQNRASQLRRMERGSE